MFMRDTLTLDGPRRTADGYLTAVAKVARTGIQEYLGSEVGMRDRAVVRVYRPPEEVFDLDALRSMAHRPVTNDHPSVAVTSDNWRELAVGIVGGEIDASDGKFISVPLALMDAAAIRDWEGGKRELSMGYTCDLDPTSGVTADGLQYDAIQRNIRANHLALVDRARGGPELKIGDHDMATKTITVDGIKVTLDEMSADVVSRALADAEKAMEELDEAKKKAADSVAVIATKDAEIATLKTQLADATNPAAIDAAVKDRAAVVDQAKAIIGDKLVVDGKSTAAMRRQVVDAKLGDVSRGWTDEQVAASFGTLVAAAPQTTDALREAIRHQAPITGDKRTAAYEGNRKRLEDAWKTRPGAA